ncbi:MAG: sugar ABC transporter permease [Bacilli bacterium]|nr:sugar ABC transporter permease [Bacilli bacterium]
MQESPSRGSLYNKVARFILPFQNYPSAIKGSTTYRKVAGILNLPFAGLGSILLGEIEVGLGLFAAYGLLGFLFVYVIQCLSTGFISISGFDAFVVLAIILFGFLSCWYGSFSKNTSDLLRLQKGKKLKGSYLVALFLTTKNNADNFFSRYREQFRISPSRVKSRMIYSWFIMGVGIMFYDHLLKGIFLLAAQILYLSYMIAVGASDLLGLFTLHQEGIASNETMVYGTVALAITVAFVLCYCSSMKTLVDSIELSNEGKRGPGVKGELSLVINEKFYVTGLIVPILGAIAFTVIPIFFMVLVAFTDYTKVDGAGTFPNPLADQYLNWVGFETFFRLFGSAQNLADMLKVFSWTMIWAILATFTCYFGGLFLAMLLNKKSIKGKVIYRSLLVISMALPQFVSLLVMRTLFVNNGPINQLLNDWGWIEWMQNNGWISEYDSFVNFWGTPSLAKTLIILINMWVGIPYYMLLMSGLLINIPKDYYEAATIEGANGRQTFTKITMPYIIYMTAPALITSFVSNINNFNVIWFLTGNADGKADDTDILITWLYKITMKSVPDYNFGAAIGIIMFIVSASVSLIVFHRSNSFKNEEEFR